MPLVKGLTMEESSAKLKMLQDLLEELQRAHGAQIDEPAYKRIRIVLDDHRTHINEIKARMQEQETKHTRQINKLMEAMVKAQEDISYLLKKTRALAEGDKVTDQPRRTALRAASGMSEVSQPDQSRSLTVNPRAVQPVQSALAQKPFLLLSNSGEVQPVGTARVRRNTRPPSGQEVQNSGSSSGARSTMEMKHEGEAPDQLALASVVLGSSSSANKFKGSDQEKRLERIQAAQNQGHILDPEELATIRAEFKEARAEATQEEERRVGDQPHASDDQRMTKKEWEDHLASGHRSNRTDEVDSSSEVSKDQQRDDGGANRLKRSTSQCSMRSGCSNLSRRARSERGVQQQTRDQFQPEKHRPHLSEVNRTSLDQIDHKGSLIYDIEYGGLGAFSPLKFNTEAEVVKSLKYLDLIGSVPAPPYKTVLELAVSQVHGHGVQGNPCLVLNFLPNQAMMEEDSVQAVTSLGGALAYPNSLCVGIVVSYKFNTALQYDDNGLVDELSSTTREFYAMDGQIFLAFQTVQIAEAFKEYINRHPLKFRCYDDSTRSTDGWISAKITAVMGKNPMADLRSNFEAGKMRQGLDVFTCALPDQLDPQWARDDEGHWHWRSRFVLREDWDTPEFHRSSVMFQKHADREVRILDPMTGQSRTPLRSTLQGIIPVSYYQFVNWEKQRAQRRDRGQGHWEDRRASSRGAQSGRS